MDILQTPHPLLRQKASLVDNIDPSYKDIVETMWKVMYDNQGIGLAAPQIGISERFFIMDTQTEPESKPWVLINPEIVSLSPTIGRHQEGCLSIAGVFGYVQRPVSVTVKFQDLRGQCHEKRFRDLEAVCVQHEIDHLNGILFTDVMEK